MFRNIFKHCTYTQYSKNLIPTTNNHKFYSSSVVGNPTSENISLPTEKSPAKDISKQNHAEDLDAALHIGASLFEHSKHEHNPTPLRDVVKHNRKVTSRKLYAPKKLETTQKPFTFKTTTIDTKSIQNPTATVSTTTTSSPIRDSLLAQQRTTRPAPLPPSDIDKKSKLIDDPDLGLQFVRLQLNDSLFTNLMTITRSKKRRDKNRQILIEGRRLIREALECNLKMHTLIFSQVEQLKLIKDIVATTQQQMGTKIYKVPQHDLKMWSSLTTPPGLMGIFERPTNLSNEILNVQQATAKVTSPLPITVICDNIREPSNLGSIIRSCAAIPCQQVIVTHGCCDPWETKALRGGCSGQFRILIRDNVEWKDMPLFIPPDVADVCHIFIAENNYEKISDNSTKINYMDLETVGAHNILIIGGESHGVSEDAYNFLQKVGNERGKCIYIPIANGIESLNVASALTLLLYELKRHISKEDMRIAGKFVADELTQQSTT